MRKLFFFSTVFAFCLLSSSSSDYGQARPIPPGVREGEKQINAQINEPAAKVKHKPADPAKLQQEADELAKLSAAIPGQIELVRQGQFPKDLEEHLKRVEKLAKQLRSEISH
jgi:hypothetical protein